MTREQALYNFFSSFGITAFPKTSVPTGAPFPYLTYETTGAYWGDGDVNIAVDLWYKTESESVPNAKVRTISEKIGLGGTILNYDYGNILVHRGNPFCVSLVEPSDNTIKRRTLNISIEDWRV